MGSPTSGGIPPGSIQGTPQFIIYPTIPSRWAVFRNPQDACLFNYRNDFAKVLVDDCPKDMNLFEYELTMALFHA
jgi:hypothetical protein